MMYHKTLTAGLIIIAPTFAVTGETMAAVACIFVVAALYLTKPMQAAIDDLEG